MPHRNHSDDIHGKSVEEICRATWKPLYRFIYFKVQNREEAEEITQETFVKAIPYLRKDKIPSDKYNGFLKTVALNVLRDRWRKKKRRGINVNIESIHPEESAIGDATEISVERLVIEEALSQLHQEQQTVIELRIIKGFSVTETAKIMDKTEVNIRVMQHRALQSLAKILNKFN